MLSTKLGLVHSNGPLLMNTFVDREKKRLIEKLAPDEVKGLLLWHHGAGWQRYKPEGIPLGKIRDFFRYYLFRPEALRQPAGRLAA